MDALGNVLALDAPMLPKSAAIAMNAATIKAFFPIAIGLSCSALSQMSGHSTSST